MDFAQSTNPQIWSCTVCGIVRQWGMGYPADSNKKPLLVCDGCSKDKPTWVHTPHSFVGVGGFYRKAGEAREATRLVVRE